MNLGDLIKKALEGDKSESETGDGSKPPANESNPNRARWDSYALKTKQSGAMHMVGHDVLEPISGGFSKELPAVPSEHPAFLYGQFHGVKEVWLWSTSSLKMQKWKLKKYTRCKSPEDHLIPVQRETCSFVLLTDIQKYIASEPTDFTKRWNEYTLPWPSKITYIVAHSLFFDCVKSQYVNTAAINEFTYRGHVDSETHTRIVQGVKLSRKGN
ncbi:MAG TPA: hypothetical protein PKW95_23025 [bacterium]|nr:hypothetical protein [bacterium]